MAAMKKVPLWRFQLWATSIAEVWEFAGNEKLTSQQSAIYES